MRASILPVLLLGVAATSGAAAAGVPDDVPGLGSPLGRARLLREVHAAHPGVVPALPPAGEEAGLLFPATDLDVTVDPATGVVTATAVLTVEGQLSPPPGAPGFYVLLDGGLSVTGATATGRTVEVVETSYPPFNYLAVDLAPRPAAGEQVVVTLEYGGTLECLPYGARGGRYCSLGPVLQHIESASAFPMVMDSRDPYGVQVGRTSLVLRMPSLAGRTAIVSADPVDQTDDGTTLVSRWVAEPISSFMTFLAVTGALDTLPVPGTTPPFAVHHVSGDPDWAAEMVGWETSIVPFLDAQAGASFPFGRVGVVKLPWIDGFPGTATYGMVYLAEAYEGLGAEGFEETLAHETAHLWWGVLAYPGDVSAWLVEGMAVLTQYDYTWATHHDPIDATAGERAVARARYLESRYRWNLLQVRYLTDPATLPPLVIEDGGTWPDTLPGQVVWAYFKSSATLDHLRVALGDAVFADGLRRYRERCVLEDCVTADFRAALEDAAADALAADPSLVLPSDLQPFLDRWVYATSYVDLQVGFAASPAGAVTVELAQADAVTGEPVAAPLPLELWLVHEDGGVTLARVVLEAASDAFVVPSPGPSPVRRVHPNPRHDAIVWSRSAQPGDVDLDGEVDGFDVIRCARLDGRQAVGGDGTSIYDVDLRFEPRCDLVADAAIGDADLASMAQHFGAGVEP